MSQYFKPSPSSLTLISNTLLYSFSPLRNPQSHKTIKPKNHTPTQQTHKLLFHMWDVQQLIAGSVYVTAASSGGRTELLGEKSARVWLNCLDLQQRTHGTARCTDQPTLQNPQLLASTAPWEGTELRLTLAAGRAKHLFQGRTSSDWQQRTQAVVSSQLLGLNTVFYSTMELQRFMN